MLVRLLVSTLVIVALIVAIAAAVTVRPRRSRQLKRRFGPEYDRAVQEHGSTSLAEAVLQRRIQRVQEFHLRFPIPADQEAYWREWAVVERRFLDDPWLAIGFADHLIVRVMTECGYPLTGFEERLADLSVNHSAIVQNYRDANAIVWRREGGRASTEELRRAMELYHSLFEALLTPDEQLNLQAIDAGGTGIDHKHAS